MVTGSRSKKIEALLSRGVEEIIDKEHLKKRLLKGQRLRIKFGVDPSKPDIHLGHTVPLRKLREFQQLGHKVIFIIGDFTARIGDPSGRSKTRPQLTVQEVNKNAETYLAQAGKVIDIKRVEMRRNSEWYDKMKFGDFIRLFSKITLARILERDDFQKRMKNNINIYPHEIIYPILQGYDSIVVKSDVEIGGTDQKFNMLIGRRLQEREGMKPQDIITVPLLVGLDGKNKMSKSLGNYVGITEPAFQQYGKIMSIPDDLILDYFKLLTDVSLKEIAKMERDLKSKRVNPKELKSSLAKEIVTFYHGKEQAEMAEKEFERVFKEKEIPTKIPVFTLNKDTLNILDLLTKTGLVSSRSEGRRLIEQKGVRIKPKDQKSKIPIKNWQEEIKIKDGMIVQVGKRKFVRIRKKLV
ncbi:tyrosine--tRNA ligase [bacterium]|nr:tyrosine--tRNA ligase [bacterium]